MSLEAERRHLALPHGWRQFGGAKLAMRSSLHLVLDLINDTKPELLPGDEFCYATCTGQQSAPHSWLLDISELPLTPTA